jgi:PAS domain S-box-containing protein
MNSSILIVEDDIIVANNLQDRLKGLGHTVCGIASSGEEALAIAAKTRPDLVLMDIKLRGTMDGVSAALGIRSHYDIPVVYLTGYADDVTLQRAKISEPYGYILKPFEVRDLHTTIEMALHKHAIEKQLRESEEKYRNLVEHSLQGIMIIREVPPRVLFANHPCAEITGYSVDELLALPPEETLLLLHPEDRVWLLERLEAQFSGKGVPATAEFRVVRKDGTLRWVVYFASLIMFDGSAAIQIAFVDVSERKEAEEALRRAHDGLERRVEERTAELAHANWLLTEEILTRQEIEQDLQHRNRELAILNALNQQVSASLSVDEVIEAALQGILASTAPDLTMFFSREEDGLRLQGLTPDDTGWREEAPAVHRLGECLCGLAASEGVPVLSDDIHGDSRCTLQECKATGMQSFAALPLLRGNEVLGVLGLGSMAKRGFSRQEAFLSAVASTVAVGLQNALLHRELQRRAAELEQEVAERRQAQDALRRYAGRLEVLHEIDRAILEAQSSEAIAQSCLNHVRVLVPCQRTSVTLFDHKAGLAIELAASFSGESRLKRGVRLPLQAYRITESLQRGDIYVAEDIASQVDAESGDVAQLTQIERMLLEEGLHTYVNVPLIAQGTLIGSLNLAAEHCDSLTPDHLEIARQVADPLAVAIQQARLREQVEQHANQLEERVGQLRRAEKALRGSEQRYRLLFERNLAGVYRSTLDGRFLECNQALARILGYETYQGLLSKPVREIYLCDADYDRFLVQLRENRALTSVECRLRRRDGSPVWCLENASFVPSRSGKPDVIQGTIIDIDERKRVEQALQESEARFRNLFENAPLCIFEVDLSQVPHAIVQANRRAQEVYGWSRAELASMSLPEIILEDLPDSDQLSASIPGGEAPTLESVHRRRDGLAFPVRVSAAPASVTDPQRVILAVEDISAEKSRRSEAEAIAEERRRMAREIHDGLAQNLASLRLRARLWHNIIDQDPDQMHAEVDAMRALLSEQIQDVRRSIFALRPVALDELGFFTAMRQFIGDFGEQNQVHTNLRILGSEDRLPSRLEPVLFRIVQEALNNVSKHAQARTAWIELDLAQADSVILVVRDDGIGFDPEQLEEAARLGHLGLRQMRERVQELEGQFRLQFQPGRGTEIRVILPAPLRTGGI